MNHEAPQLRTAIVTGTIEPLPICAGCHEPILPDEDIVITRRVTCHYACFSQSAEIFLSLTDTVASATPASRGVRR
jgi:hypothetical protein